MSTRPSRGIVSAIETRSVAELARRLEGCEGLVVLDGDGRGERGRFSYVAAEPVELVEARYGDARPLERLRRIDEDARALEAEGIVPRWVGFLAYDAAWSASPDARLPRGDAPILRFGRYDAIAIFDHTRGTARLHADDEAARDRFLARASRATRSPSTIGPIVEEPPDLHLRAIEETLEAILDGKLYQVNLARRFHASFEGSSLALYEAMREASPVPFGFYASGPELAVLGRSMERFLAWDRRAGRLETRPIKGTVAESLDRGDDARRLRADPKEHAEHVMVVDLLRNDLGRIAVPGSVQVEEALAVEPFARLSHLVSTIACRPREDVGLVEVLEATFPPGSVTGTPKRRAVERIERIERHARGLYCGAYGFVARGGDVSLAVAIRTATIADGQLVYGAGGGIVAASDPARELAETELKTRALRDAIERLPRRAP